MAEPSLNGAADVLLPAERSVLGAMMLHSDAVADVAFLSPEDFYLPRHRVVYGAILAVHASGRAADPIVVADELSKRGRLLDAGGADSLIELADAVVTAAGVSYHADIVREHSQRRRLEATLREMLARTHDGDDITELVADAQRRLLDIEPKGHPAMRPAPKLPTMLDWLDVAQLPAPDWSIEGLLPERSLGVLAGAPASCKSLLVQDWCARMVYGMAWRGRAVKPGSVLYLAGEGFGGLGMRARAWRAQNNAGGTEGRFFAVANGVPVLSTPDGAAELDAMLPALVAKYGQSPSLVVVDTLSQAFGAGDENDARTVAPVMRSLSEIRTRHGCAVLVIHHLSKPQQGTPTALSLNSVRGSSALVGNVDVVLGVLAIDGVQTLKVLKLKDGEAAPPIRSQVLVVETGRTFDNGQPERSAILVPAVAEATAPEKNLNAEADEQVHKIVAALQAMGGRTSSMKSVTKRLRGRSTDLLAAFGEAVDRNLIVKRTVRGERFYEVAGGSKEGACAPPIPPVREPEPQQGSVPLLGVLVPGTNGNQTGTSEPNGSSEPDDGLPDQPKGSRKRKAVPR